MHIVLHLAVAILIFAIIQIAETGSDPVCVGYDVSLYAPHSSVSCIIKVLHPCFLSKRIAIFVR
jgi:hypothetical protein